MSKLMKKGAMLTALVVSIGLAGCASHAGIESRLDALESAVAAAQATANNAMDSARSAQACCDANSEKMRRMFEKTGSK